ncbi:hypothetical protein C8J56DRAFT_754698, partial [Mycena floridula]
TSSYFTITSPSTVSTWNNDRDNILTWSKSPTDGISHFDIEMARLSTDGLLYVARNVPAVPPFLHIVLQDIAAGDDYFFFFLNATHGGTYASSPRFTVVDDHAPSVETPAPVVGETKVAGGPTVTLSGSPGPTKGYAMIFDSYSRATNLSWSL